MALLRRLFAVAVLLVMLVTIPGLANARVKPAATAGSTRPGSLRATCPTPKMRAKRHTSRYTRRHARTRTKKYARRYARSRRTYRKPMRKHYTKRYVRRPAKKSMAQRKATSK